MSGDCMRFPDTVEEFMEQYKVVDKEGIYMSKGAKLVPIFRMEQWFEHEKAQLSQKGTTKGTTSDLISRRDAIDALMERFKRVPTNAIIAKDIIENLPSAQPEGTIPISWMETKITQLISMDNKFAGLAVHIIKTLLNEWKKEQEGDTK